MSDEDELRKLLADRSDALAFEMLCNPAPTPEEPALSIEELRRRLRVAIRGPDKPSIRSFGILDLNGTST